VRNEGSKPTFLTLPGIDDPPGRKSTLETLWAEGSDRVALSTLR